MSICTPVTLCAAKVSMPTPAPFQSLGTKTRRRQVRHLGLSVGPPGRYMLAKGPCQQSALKEPKDVFASPVAPVPFKVRGRYAKHEYRIPMRDGVKLFTSVYSYTDGHGPYPFLIQRTCYSDGPSGPDKFPATLVPASEFAPSGCLFVYLDVRGLFNSVGTRQLMYRSTTTIAVNTDVPRSEYMDG